METKVTTELTMSYSITPIYCADCGGPSFCYQCWNGEKEHGRATVCISMTFMKATYQKFHLCDVHNKEWQRLPEADKARIALAMQEIMQKYLAAQGRKS